MITSLLYLTMDRSWQVQLVRWGQEPRNHSDKLTAAPILSISSLSLSAWFCSATKSSVSVITNALIIFNCPLSESYRNHFVRLSSELSGLCHHVSGLSKLCVDANFVSMDHSISISLDLTSAGGFLKLIQQSDCVWVRADINWTPNLFIGRKNGNCKRN